METLNQFSSEQSKAQIAAVRQMLARLNQDAAMLSRALSNYHGLSEDLDILKGGVAECFICYADEIGVLYSNRALASISLATFLDVFDIHSRLVNTGSSSAEQDKDAHWIFRNVLKLALTISFRLSRRALGKIVALFRGYWFVCFSSRESTYIHKAAFLAQGFNGFPFLYQACLFKKQKQNRKRLFQSLTSVGFTIERASVIAELFPVSYVEQFHDIYRLASQIKVQNVYTSMYGLMLDPVLALAISLNKSIYYYVQHGGSYCLISHWLHELERASCDKMIFWGLGDLNVQPTRFNMSTIQKTIARTAIYRSILRPKKQVIAFIAGGSLKEQDLERLKDFIDNITSFCGPSCKIMFCDHPRSPCKIASSFCNRERWIYVIGTRLGRNLKSHLVIYDSLNHTLIYERIMANLPFVVLQQPSAEYAPVHGRAKKFVSSLEASKVVCSNFDGSFISCLSDDKKCDFGLNYFRQLIAEARSLVVDNISLVDLVATSRATSLVQGTTE